MSWPRVYDTPRLAMSILIAGRALHKQRNAAPAREVAAHARAVSRPDLMDATLPDLAKTTHHLAP